MPSLVLHLQVLLLTLAALGSAPARAQGASEVQAYLLSVKRLYEDLENESALKQIARARTLPRTQEEEVTLSLYEGVIQADLSRWEASAAAFKAALTQDPEARLPVRVSPKVEQHFETVRQEVNQELAARAKPPPAPAPPPPLPAPPEKEPEPEAAVAQVQTRSFTRPQVLIPAITGGVLLVAGGATWAMSRQELSRLNNDDPALTTREEAHSAASRGSTLQTVGVGLLGAGVVGLGIATGWYTLGQSSNELSLKLGTDGTSAFVQGRWP